MSHIDGQQDRDLHNADGSHRSTAPSADGQVGAQYERRIAAHIDMHKQVLPDFPSALMMRTIPANANSVELDAMNAHNRVIDAYSIEHAPTHTSARLRGTERAILGLAAGLDAWCRWNRKSASEPFGSMEITRPLYDAFTAALNHDTGRLNARTLHEWSRKLLAALDVDTD